MTIEENDEALVVEIYAQQFNWKARYSGDDGVLGDANVRFLLEFGGKNLVGIDPTDPNGEDDVVVQELHLPVDRQVVFRIRSQDVLHSMYMPHFRAQMNAVPGMINQFAFTPNVTTREMRLKKEVVDCKLSFSYRFFLYQHILPIRFHNEAYLSLEINIPHRIFHQIFRIGHQNR